MTTSIEKLITTLESKNLEFKRGLASRHIIKCLNLSHHTVLRVLK